MIVIAHLTNRVHNEIEADAHYSEYVSPALAIAEKTQLIFYAITHGTLPPGNLRFK